MFKISDEDIKFWGKYIENVDELVKSGDLDTFIIEMNYAMAREGFTDDLQFLNDVGKLMQDSYDKIYWENNTGKDL